MSISGSLLTTPRPDWTFHVLSEREGNTLILHIAELPDDMASGAYPSDIAEVRITPGTLPRTLDVLREFIDVLGAYPDMRSKLNNLEPMLDEQPA
jgi:hypothetical protein